MGTTARVPLRYRITAILLAAFCALSAARGLVPRLCLNFGDLLEARLLAPEPASSCDTLTAGRSCCCPAPAKEEDQPAPATKQDAHCPFCEMAKALVEVPEVFYIEIEPETVADTFAEPVRPVLASAPAALRNRAPPASFAPLT